MAASAKELMIHSIPVYKFPVVIPKKPLRWAQLYYVHHDLTIEDINQSLQERGCRPANAKDLQGFFKSNHQILPQMNSFEAILATGNVEKIKVGYRMPAILMDETKKGIKKVILGTATFSSKFINGHSAIFVFCLER